VKNYIEPGIGALRLDHLRVADVQAWLNRLATQCQCCAQEKDVRRALRGAARCCALGKCCHQVASPRTIKDVRTVLRSALHSAVRQELIDRNVAQLVQIPKQRKRKILPWTSEEARRFLESARSDSDPLYAAYVLVLVLGLRKGEVLGLAWDAVNFEQGTRARPSAPTSPTIPSLPRNEDRGIRCLAPDAERRGRGIEDQAHTTGLGTGGCRRDLAADE
jgi:integrase